MNYKKNMFLNNFKSKIRNKIVKLIQPYYDQILINQGLILEQTGCKSFKIFSQFDEDGIISYLIRKIPIKSTFFLEFGVEDYIESNTRYLLMSKNWSGVIVDSSKEYIKKIKNSYYYWKYDLTVVNSFIKKENINDIINKYIPFKEIGLLSIDIDGNDYWILKEINLETDILICEFNPWFGFKKAITIPYIGDFIRTKYSKTYSYYGASFLAIKQLAQSKGYIYVGMSIGGQNAFFVNTKYKNFIKEIDLPKFNEAKFRNPLSNGIMADKNIARKEWLSADLKVIDIEFNRKVYLKDLVKDLS